MVEVKMYAGWAYSPSTREPRQGFGVTQSQNVYFTYSQLRSPHMLTEADGFSLVVEQIFSLGFNVK